jgi:beta-glucanase (GH16 family)
MWVTVAAISTVWSGAGGVGGSLLADGTSAAERWAPVHWQLAATEDFDAGLDPTRWTPYSGVPGCCPDTVWSPDQVRVHDGKLTLRASPDDQGVWASAGVGGWNWDEGTRLYGRWDARVRMDVGGGVSATALLWPTSGWPPEVNYFEIFNQWANRDRMAVTTHYTEDQAPNLSQWIVHADFTRWHVVSVRWTPQRLLYVVDGRRVLIESNPDRIPRTEMWPAFQTHVHRLSDGQFPELIPGQQSIRMQVDWVRVFDGGWGSTG